MTTVRESYDDEDIRTILKNTKSIAVVGASADRSRASNQVMRYLQNAGFRVIPVNPTISGQQLFGETVYPSLAEVPMAIDLVDVFRRTEFISGIVDEILPLAAEKGIKTLWLQLEIYEAASAQRARAAGLQVVMDRCVKIEHNRLLG